MSNDKPIFTYHDFVSASSHGAAVIANAKVAPLIARLKEQEELLNDAEELAKTAVMLLEKMGRGHFTQTIACYCEWLDKRQKAKAEK